MTKDDIKQQDIIRCLSSIDKVIALQEQKLKILRKHKRGLEQMLLSKDGTKS